jgi:lipoprotein-anchoring transpeptidase ErfK/SrfK
MRRTIRFLLTTAAFGVAFAAGDRVELWAKQIARAAEPPVPLKAAPPNLAASASVLVDDLEQLAEKAELEAAIEADSADARSAVGAPVPLAAGAEPQFDATEVPELGDLDLSQLAELPLEEPVAHDPDAEPSSGALVAISRETWVFSKPKWRSRKLGYLRAGSIVAADPKPSGHSSCKGGWYRVDPQGYVCVGPTATLDLDHPVALLSQARPKLDGLPYVYVRPRFPTPPMYARLPTVVEQEKSEAGLSSHKRSYAKAKRDSAFVALPDPAPLPETIASHQQLPSFYGEKRTATQLFVADMLPRSGFALIGIYQHEGRPFGLTTEMALLPLDRMRRVAESSFHGVPLSEEFTLPIAIVRGRRAKRHTMTPGGAFAPIGKLPRGTSLALTGRSERRRGTKFHEAMDGSWMRADQVVRIDALDELPSYATAKRRKKRKRAADESEPAKAKAPRPRKWIDVSINRQALVAYEGERPVFATLVSTGADGTGDPDKTHSTVQGTFLIHTKHVSVTMDGDEEGDEFDLRDVPYVQYFKAGYALHAAYWHDDFGTPRSHGCVNLAPKDAAWLFGWTTPGVPDGWHAALSLRHGTLIRVHP